ncbi:MAG TPA: acyltransferase [Usitatibacter sp.]|nr:acyltransferase [Usitatibacter sp.]
MIARSEDIAAEAEAPPARATPEPRAGVRAIRFENVNLLRAFAALSVVMYHVIEHSHWTAFPITGPLLTFRIGWIGVDLFFVISGFVITYSALILRANDRAGFAGHYWARRLTRIVPLYVLTIAVWIATMYHGFFAQPFRDWGWQLFTHLAFIHSFFVDTHSAIDGVNWTLAIEMQFYLAIALLIGWIERTPAWRIAAYAIAISWAWRACMLVLFGFTDPWILFMRVTQLPGTLDEFAAGIVFAKLVLARPAPARGETLLWLVGAAVLGYVAMALFWPRASYWFFPPMVVFWRTLFSAFLLCVLAAAVRLPQVIAHRWLRPLDYLGETSYGIYLWHLFAVEYVIHQRGMRELQATAWVLGLTILAASCSWRWFEKPFMGLARRPAAPVRAAA